jgi:hypothetical protein
MEEDDGAGIAANSEIRYIALELMKIAQKSGRKFEDVAGEYMRNAEILAGMISGEESLPAKKAGKASSKDR